MARALVALLDPIALDDDFVKRDKEIDRYLDKKP